MYRTMSALRLQYWWPGMQGDVRGYIRHCVVCQQAKVVTQKPQGLLQPLSVPEYAFSDVTTDLITGLPKTECGFDAIATFVCYLSKYAYFVACHSMITAEEYANLFLQHVVAHHGMPKKLVIPILHHAFGVLLSVLWGANMQCLHHITHRLMGRLSGCTAVSIKSCTVM